MGKTSVEYCRILYRYRVKVHTLFSETTIFYKKQQQFKVIDLFIYLHV
jgi:hypothetical protein